MTDNAENESTLDDESIEQDKEPVQEPVQEPAQQQKSVLLPIVVAISLLLALMASAGAGYTWFYTQQDKITQSHITDSLNKKITAVNERQQKNKLKNTEKQKSLKDQQQQISTRLDKVAEKLGRNSHDWAVSEIRYTLRQASIRLQLFQEKETALHALKIADQQLARLADPALHKVRATLNKEIIALSSVETIDVEGISLKLSALKSQVETLSLNQHEKMKQNIVINPPVDNADETSTEWKKHADVIWSEMKSLVRIQRTDKKILPLLGEQESLQIKQALGLKIEIARMALLQRNTSLFQASLKEAIGWLNKFFNTEQAAVSAIIEQLTSMNGLNLEPDFPDISGALSQLETLQNSVAPAREKKAQ